MNVCNRFSLANVLCSFSFLFDRCLDTSCRFQGLTADNSTEYVELHENQFTGDVPGSRSAYPGPAHSYKKESET